MVVIYLFSTIIFSIIIANSIIAGIIKIYIRNTDREREVVDTLDIGSISYKIKPFYMVSLDVYKAYREIKAKIDDGKPLTKQDLMSIVFLPIKSS